MLLMASAPITPLTAQTAPAASKASRPIPRTVFMQRNDAVFVAVDTNKDGFADRAELLRAQTRGLNAQKSEQLRQREAAFRRLDRDNNGSLTLAEFNAIAAAAPMRPDAAPVLARFDTNKDGKISLSEHRAPALAQFARADTNRDGSLSPAEERAAAARR
jgi:hypothetical protein